MSIVQFFIYFSSGYAKRGKIELWYQQSCLRLSFKQLTAIPEHVIFTVQGRDYFREEGNIVRVERTVWTVNY